MKLGELQTLTVEKTVPFGIYLRQCRSAFI